MIKFLKSNSMKVIVLKNQEGFLSSKSRIEKAFNEKIKNMEQRS